MKRKILLAVLIVIAVFAGLAGVKALQVKKLIAFGAAFVPPPESVSSAVAREVLSDALRFRMDPRDALIDPFSDEPALPAQLGDYELTPGYDPGGGPSGSSSGEGDDGTPSDGVEI